MPSPDANTFKMRVYRTVGELLKEDAEALEVGRELDNPFDTIFETNVPSEWQPIELDDNPDDSENREAAHIIASGMYLALRGVVELTDDMLNFGSDF